MFRLDADLQVYLHREAIDFRKSINGLVMLVEQSYGRTGFWLLMKRLEQDRFIWPHRSQEALELTAEQLHWLLDGIDIEAVRRHPERQYRHAG